MMLSPHDFMHFSNDGAVRLGDILAMHLEPWLRTLK